MKEDQEVRLRRLQGCRNEVWGGIEKTLEKLRGGEIENSGVKLMGRHTASLFVWVQTILINRFFIGRNYCWF